MKQGAQKSKGNAFENKIAKELSLWLTGGKREDVLIRSQNSGGRATVLAYSGRNFVSQAGDITAVDSEGFSLMDAFIIECKHHQNLYLEALIFKSRKDGVIAHWDKLLSECLTYSKMPFYVARQNGKPILAAFNSEGVEFFEIQRFLTASIFHLDLHLIQFDEFLKRGNKKRLPGITGTQQPIIKRR